MGYDSFQGVILSYNVFKKLCLKNQLTQNSPTGDLSCKLKFQVGINSPDQFQKKTHHGKIYLEIPIEILRMEETPAPPAMYKTL